jgi:hypothetical protein
MRGKRFIPITVIDGGAPGALRGRHAAAMG